MNKRIVAWILLICFVLLLVNIFIIGYQRMLSLFIYLIIAVSFLLTMKKQS